MQKNNAGERNNWEQFKKNALRIVSYATISASILLYPYFPSQQEYKNRIIDRQNIVQYKTDTADLSCILKMGDKVWKTMHYGPAVMLNGLTDTGEWYQFGISYKWPAKRNGSRRWTPENGFEIFIEVWGKDKSIIYNKEFAIKNSAYGKEVEITMYIDGKNIDMEIKNIAGKILFGHAIKTDANYFEGFKSLKRLKRINNEYNTGIMTEKYAEQGKPRLPPKIAFINSKELKKRALEEILHSRLEGNIVLVINKALPEKTFNLQDKVFLKK